MILTIISILAPNSSLLTCQDRALLAMLSIQGLKLDGPNGGVDVSKVAQKEFVLKVLVKPPKLVYETWPSA